MITVKTPIRADEVRLSAKHVLYVEGRDVNSVDPKILSNLLPDEIRIEPLGPSFSVQSVAEALYKHHPTYYFLIDRDHHDDNFVEKCWSEFPNPETNNLLVWRRREIENYFLDPKFLAFSRYHCTTRKSLCKHIVQCARNRVYLDVANQVIVSIREALKRPWIPLFSDLSDFPTEQCALAQLRDANQFDLHRVRVSNLVSFNEIKNRFKYTLESMTGGQEDLIFGKGKWLHFIRGKKVLNQVINSNHFHVQGLTGREKLNAIIKDLLREDFDSTPDDFIALRDLVKARIDEGS